MPALVTWGRAPVWAQGVHSALLVVACFGAGLAALAAVHARVSDASAGDPSMRSILAWRRMTITAAGPEAEKCGGSSGGGTDESANKALLPSAVLLGKLYRDAPLSAGAQWRALIALGSGTCSELGPKPGPDTAPGVAPGTPAPMAGDPEDTQQGDGPPCQDPESDTSSTPVSNLAAFTADRAAARALLRRLLPLQAAAAAAATAAAEAAEADDAGGAEAGKGGTDVGPRGGQQAGGVGAGWRLRGEAQLVAAGALAEVTEELQRNACYQGTA